jgi:trigger factor
MSTVENIDVNKFKITFSVDAATFEDGLKKSYNKNKNYFNIPGFRKGKAPRKLIEAQYGKEILFDDAFNFVLQDAYPKAAEESGLEIVSRPEIGVEDASTENGVTFTAEVYVKPEAKISNYKGLTYKKQNLDATEEEIDAQIKTELEKHKRTVDVTDRAIADGDIAVIDFEGFMDGEAFEGGKGSDFSLKIGSKTFIDTFEEQLIGKNIGDDVEVNVTFPEDYGQKDLAGKPALFKVEVKAIKFEQFPELTDEFVQDIAEEGIETVADYKNDVKAKILLKKKNEAENAQTEELMEKLVAKAEMSVPQAMVDNEIDLKIQEFRNGLAQQGIPLETYLQYMGQSMENMREAYRLISEKQVKTRLALEAVAVAENIEVSDEEYAAEIEKIAKAYNMEKDKLAETFGEREKKSISLDVKVQKALELVKENAVAEE